MLNVNRKNYYIIWKISVRLKKMKKYLVDKIQ